MELVYKRPDTNHNRYFLSGDLNTRQLKPLLKGAKLTEAHLSLNMEAVKQIEPKAMKMLMQLVKAYLVKGMHIRLESVSPSIQTYLELFQVDQFFVYTSEHQTGLPYSA